SCPEHVVIPAHIAATRGARYWDPVVTLSTVAAHTSTIKLLSHVLVLGYHHPLEVLKTWGSLDAASGGRVVLGVGVGTLRQEFEVLGVPYENRGGRADEALAAIRAGFAEREPVFEGTEYRYRDVVVDPCGVNRSVPIWVGGRTRRSLRRALELGDGWLPFGLVLDELRAVLEHPPLAEARRARPIDLILAPEPPLDPLGDRETAAAVVAAYGAAGATGLHLRFVHTSRPHYVDQLEAMAQIVAEVT
ncbi:MAG: TIGR03619 family F420-dependent LLM class oxidoreductase, partial [Acidimicrobiales bacterium]